jgi:FkbM family methyltransferase
MTFKQRLKEIIYRRYNIGFAKSGEDLQLKKLINKNEPGVYLDIGCWDPIKASNSYYFYVRKWKGICVDPNPELRTLYKNLRPNDLFINKGVSNKSDEELTYYMLGSDYKSSMNTFDKDFLIRNDLVEKVTKTINVPTIRIDTILSENYSDNERLDFFDIDVEGHDLEVLKTNNWSKYRPKIILIESHISLQDDISSDITKYLESVNYSLIGKSLIHKKLGNLYFIDNNQ